jgi:diguanylate cyclase (GGDEF)-like protein
VQIEQQMMGRMSGALWLLGGTVAAAGQAMPGVPHDHPWVAWGLIALVCVYGIACLKWIPWSRMSLRDHLVAILIAQPFIAVGLWVSGGVNSYIVPLLVLAMLYSAYFLPGRLAWIGVGALAITNATPLIYTDVGEDQALARILAFALACEGVTLTLQAMKRKLAAAADAQLAQAGSDGLTGPADRTGVQRALARAIAAAGSPGAGRRAQDPGHVALLRIAVDDLRGIDERLGPRSGDGVLRELAGRVGPLVRSHDTVARMDSDALAVVAGGAAEPGARRLAQAVRVAAAGVTAAPGEPPVALTVSWAVFPDDGLSVEDLLAVATGNGTAAVAAAARSAASDVEP